MNSIWIWHVQQNGEDLWMCLSALTFILICVIRLISRVLNALYFTLTDLIKMFDREHKTPVYEQLLHALGNVTSVLLVYPVRTKLTLIVGNMQ